MPDDPKWEQERVFLDGARRAAGLNVRDLWLRYFAAGGLVGERAVSDYLEGAGTLVDVEYNVLAYAVNERLLELGQSPDVGYRSD